MTPIDKLFAHFLIKLPVGLMPSIKLDYRKAVEAGGFIGNTIVGTDLATVRLRPK